jgi:hypothetical protein
MKETVAIIAALLAVIGNVPYMIDVIRGRVEPHAYTWFIWTIVSCVVFFGQLASGAGWGAVPTGASEIFTVFIFILSLRYGWKHIEKSDHLFLVVALLGLIPWALTDDPTLSVITVVTIDVIAFIPTLRKTWRKPYTETPLLYGTNVARHLLALFALSSYNIATTFHSIAMIITNSMMTGLIYLSPHRRKKRVL